MKKMYVSVDCLTYIYEMNKVPVIDLFKINPINPEDAEHSANGRHPNDRSYEVIAMAIGEELLKI